MCNILMWIRIINSKVYGYKTYKNSCNDVNRLNVYYDGLFFVLLR